MSTSSVQSKSLTKHFRSLFPFHPGKEVPNAKAAIERCRKVVQSLVNLWSSGRGPQLANFHQWAYLMQWVESTNTTLDTIQKLPLLDDSTIPVLEELHQILHTADTLMTRSYIRGTNVHCLRAAMEQGDLKLTFSHLLFDIHWSMNVLQCILLENSKESSIQFDPTMCDLSLSVSDEMALMTAKNMDEKDLIVCIQKIVRDIDELTKTEATFARRLLAKLESNSPSLVVLKEEDIDLKGPIIARGGQGLVRKSKFLDSECVVKAVEPTSYKKELEAIQKLGNHPHIVCHFCCSKSDPEENAYLVMELLKTDLKNALEERRKYVQVPLPLVEAVPLMLRIGEGMKYMHGKGVAHRDLKPGNILLNSEKLEGCYEVKIADFGSTKAAERTETNTMDTGTTKYMAPEVMHAKGDSKKARVNLLKADVYSFAMTSVHILTGKYPLQMSYEKFRERTKAGERRILRNELPNCPLRLVTLLTKCWSHDPHERPPFTEICRELRYIKGLLLKGDEQKLQTQILSPTNLLGSVKLEGPWGGSGRGQEFCDMATSIEKIELAFDDSKLERLFKVTYNILGKTTVRSYLKNSPTSDKSHKKKTIKFERHEFIKQISVYAQTENEQFVRSLTIHTNLKNHGPFGKERGTKFTSDKDSRVIGFHGEGDIYLYKLGVVTIPNV